MPATCIKTEETTTITLTEEEVITAIRQHYSNDPRAEVSLDIRRDMLCGAAVITRRETYREIPNEITPKTRRQHE